MSFVNDEKTYTKDKTTRKRTEEFTRKELEEKKAILQTNLARLDKRKLELEKEIALTKDSIKTIDDDLTEMDKQ